MFIVAHQRQVQLRVVVCCLLLFERVKRELVFVSEKLETLKVTRRAGMSSGGEDRHVIGW